MTGQRKKYHCGSKQTNLPNGHLTIVQNAEILLSRAIGSDTSVALETADGKETKYLKMKMFIPHNVPSSKNSKVMTKRGIFHSKTVSKYLQKIGVKSYSSKGYENYKRRPNLFLNAINPMKNALNGKKTPFVIGFFFIRNSKRKFDFINACQIICDLLVAHGVIEDDDVSHLIPVPVQINGLWHTYNKDHPGVYLFVLSEKNIEGLKHHETRP